MTDRINVAALIEGTRACLDKTWPRMTSSDTCKEVLEGMLAALRQQQAEIVKLYDRIGDLETENERLDAGKATLYVNHCKQVKRQQAEIEGLRAALEFYADPETYAAIVVIGDSPCGEFVDDFSDDHGHPFLDGHRPGKRARAALAAQPHVQQAEGA